MPLKKRKRTRKRIANVLPLSRTSPFPKSYKCKMRYSGFIALNADHENLSTQYFVANGLYNPGNAAAGALQPYGYDQMADIYDHYHVLGSKMKVSFNNPLQSDTAIDLSMVGVSLEDAIGITYTTGKPQDYWQRPSTKKMLITPQEGTKTLTQTFSARKFFNSKVLDDDQQRGSKASNPAEKAYFYIAQSSQNPSATGPTGATDPQQVRAYVEIDYTVVWSEPRSYSSSHV